MPRPMLDASAEAKAWLQQFDDPDVPVAQDLLQSLVLVSTGEFSGSLTSQMQTLVTNAAAPVAVYAIREVEDDESYFANKRDRPIPVASNQVGSEGTVAHLITQWTRGEPTRFLNHPPLSTLKKRRVHDVVFVDDLIGSGNRALRFMTSFCRHKTVRSWNSLHLLRYHIVAYAAAEDGVESIREHVPRNVVNVDRGRLDIHYMWNASPQLAAPTLNVIRQLCRTYGRRGRIRGFVREGFNRRMTTVVFEHGCPNNAPGILWFPTPVWTPLFPQRAIPAGLRGFFQAPPSGTFLSQRAHEILGSQSASIAQTLGQEGVVVLLVLTGLRRRIRHVERLAGFAGIDVSRCESILANCHALGLTGAGNVLSAQGTKELAHAQRLASMVKDVAPLNEGFYFPRSLRPTTVTG